MIFLLALKFILKINNPSNPFNLWQKKQFVEISDWSDSEQAKQISGKKLIYLFFVVLYKSINIH